MRKTIQLVLVVLLILIIWTMVSAQAQTQTPIRDSISIENASEKESCNVDKPENEMEKTNSIILTIGFLMVSNAFIAFAMWRLETTKLAKTLLFLVLLFISSIIVIARLQNSYITITSIIFMILSYIIGAGIGINQKK